MNAIDLNINDLYQGKATMIKDNKYFSTQQYIEPFIDRVDKLCQGNFIIKAQPANQISLTPQGDVNMEDIVFNRVWVQGVLPGEYAYENHQQSINMLYALDTRKPLVKIFKNTLNMACLNMCVFNPEFINIQELAPDAAINYSFTDYVLKLVDDTKIRLEALAKLAYDPEELKVRLGNWIDKCIKYKYTNNFGTIKLSETLPIEVYKNLLINDKSPYYRKDQMIDGFTIYNAFTDIITNDRGKDIVNKYEKIYMVSNLLEENND